MSPAPSVATDRDLQTFGDSILRWRKLGGLTSQMVADRAGITRTTLRSIERGDGSAKLATVFAVLRVLEITDLLVDAIEPLRTDRGRLNVERMLPKRVTPRRAPS